MKNLVRVLAIGVLATAAMAVTLNRAWQPTRYQWQAFRFSTSAPANGTALQPVFRKSLSPSGGFDFGQAEWRMGGISCTFETAGTTDGGTNTLSMRVIYLNQDAGIGAECTCDMGTGSCTAAGTALQCDCPAVRQLSGDDRFFITYGNPSGCETNPTRGYCSVELFR